ncbi:MAG: hypothetical protein HY360_23360 [Verrucomicrobia bacterium]|nr:hypothetical protein [Verrucomicrobiota bacterium]
MSITPFSPFQTLKPSVRFLGRILAGSDTNPSFVGIALISVVNGLLVGYDFAVGDQPLYLALVDRYRGLCEDQPADLYLSTFLGHSYTVFWILLAPLSDWFGWEWLLFIGYVVARFCIFWGLWRMTLSLTRDRRAAWFVLLFLVMNKCLVGNPIHLYETNTSMRLAVLPLLFFAMEQLWRNRFVASGILFGLAFEMHALSAIIWLVIAATGLVFNWRGILFETGSDGKRTWAGLRRLAEGGVAFGLVILPMLIWVWTMPAHPEGHAPSHQELCDLVRARHAYIFSAVGTPRAGYVSI